MIIGILSQKGGVGKTTLSINLAACFADGGLNVLLVDADPQGSAQSWSSVRQAEPLFPVIGMAKPSLHKDLPGIAGNYDVTIIDGAPRVNDLGRASIMASDLIIIPVQPSPYDVWAAEDTVALVEEARVFKENLKAVFAINRKIVKTAIGRDVETALGDYPFSILKSHVCQRVVFAESAATGRTIFEAAENSEAAREVRAMAEEIWQMQQGESS